MELSEKILGSFYKPEVIHTKAVQKIGKGEITVTYIFPPYQRTLQNMDHVSMTQMNEGLLEGLYSAIGYAIEAGEISAAMDLATYIRSMAQALFMKEEISYRKMLKAGEEAELQIKVVNVQQKMRGKYIAVTLTVEGFMRGEVECWLAVS